MTPRDRDLVYSSDQGRLCPDCGRSLDDCICRRSDGQKTSPQRTDGGPVRIARQTKGRKGKTVTVITGLPLDGLELADLAKELKRQCGSGGTVKDGVIEIQGDHRDRLVAELQRRGWTAKKAGG